MRLVCTGRRGGLWLLEAKYSPTIENLSVSPSRQIRELYNIPLNILDSSFVLTRVLQRNWTNSIYIYKGIDSHDFGGWDVPRSAIFKLVMQGSWWWSSKCWELESWWCILRFQSESLRTRNTEGRRSPKSRSNSQAENEVNLPLPFCFLQSFSGVDDAPPSLERGICFN